MKVITAIIKPFKLDDVRDALNKLGVAGMTVTQVEGFGRQRGPFTVYRGPEYAPQYVPKLKVEVLIAADQADQVFDTIVRAAHTGQTGDGKVYVLNVEKLAGVRTGALDYEALS